VEAAFVVSLLLMLIIGIVWLARAYNVYETLTRAAREGARFAVTPLCATCGNTYPPDTAIQSIVDQALAASSLDPAQVTGFTVTRGLVLNPGATPQDIGTEVSFSYPFQFYLPFTSTHLTTISMTASVRMREE